MKSSSASKLPGFPAANAWERACQKHWILMGSKFWDGLREWGQEMMKAGVFARDEIGFGYVTDSPKEAVDRIVRSLPAGVLKRRITTPL